MLCMVLQRRTAIMMNVLPITDNMDIRLYVTENALFRRPSTTKRWSAGSIVLFIFVFVVEANSILKIFSFSVFKQQKLLLILNAKWFSRCLKVLKWWMAVLGTINILVIQLFPSGNKQQKTICNIQRKTKITDILISFLFFFFW